MRRHAAAPLTCQKKKEGKKTDIVCAFVESNNDIYYTQGAIVTVTGQRFSDRQQGQLKEKKGIQSICRVLAITTCLSSGCRVSGCDILTSQCRVGVFKAGGTVSVASVLHVGRFCMHSKCFVWGPIIIMCCVALHFIYEFYLYILLEIR